MTKILSIYGATGARERRDLLGVRFTYFWLVIAEHIHAGCCVFLYPIFQTFVAMGCDGACCWCFDELGSKTEEFFVCVFFDITDDLCVGVSWVIEVGAGEIDDVGHCCLLLFA